MFGFGGSDNILTDDQVAYYAAMDPSSPHNRSGAWAVIKDAAIGAAAGGAISAVPVVGWAAAPILVPTLALSNAIRGSWNRWTERSEYESSLNTLATVSAQKGGQITAQDYEMAMSKGRSISGSVLSMSTFMWTAFGAVAGAVVGSFVPGVGTGVGLMAGAALMGGWTAYSNYKDSPQVGLEVAQQISQATNMFASQQQGYAPQQQQQMGMGQQGYAPQQQQQQQQYYTPSYTPGQPVQGAPQPYRG